jgi:hypothetical protein
MRNRLIRTCLTVLALSTAARCLAADSPWDGTWKLNRARSQMTGATFTYSKNPDGSLRYSNGSSVAYNFACDGKEYPTVSERTITCTTTGDTIYETTTKSNGKILTVSHRLLSADGKTMTMETMGVQPDGTTFTDRNTFQRVSGTTGLVGKWRTTKTASTTPEIEVMKVTGEMMHTEFPGYQDRVDAKMDGSDAPFVGATLPPGLTVAIRVEGPRRLHVTQKMNGKVLGETTQTVSEDGKTLTEVSWVTGKIAEKQTLVYERQ